VKTTQQLELFSVPLDSNQERLDVILFRSLHHFQDAEKRWSKSRQLGLTDTELKEAIACEYGIYGGGTHPEWHCYQGGEDPKCWLSSISPHGKPTLRGQPLLERVRSLLKIPYPLN
jgi:hypothetical protein